MPKSSVVDLASVAERDDDDQEHVVVDGVDDAIVTDPNAESGSALQGAGGRWTRVVRQEGDRTLHAVTYRWVEPAQRSDSPGAQLDAISAHSQPRSALACSQGMFGPSSSIAASKAATSSASSRAAISFS